MAELEDSKIKGLLEEALWQVEEAKKLGLSISKAMNFINLSREAQEYENKRLSLGLIGKARDTLFSDMVDNIIKNQKDGNDAVGKMRLERTLKEARMKFNKGELKDAYEILKTTLENNEDCEVVENNTCMDENKAQIYAEALDSLQKVWLKMKQEEGKGKDMSKAKNIIRDAKRSLSRDQYSKVLELCQQVMEIIQSPQDRLKEEVDETIEDITRTLKALFPGDPRSPKERFFKKQIEDLITQAKDMMLKERAIEAINYSRKAKEILSRLEQESIKGDIPKMIIDLRASINELKNGGVEVSYEEYLLKQVEETFWKGEYIKARKIANKLESITRNAKQHLMVTEISTRLTSLDQELKDKAGQEGYLQAKEFIDKAKILMDQSAFDMASSFLDKAGDVLHS
jgi:hypothetical protein